MEPHLFIIRGLPGSGKSTLARSLAAAIGADHVEADMYFIGPDGKYEFDQAKLRSAHAWCRESARLYISKGQSVVVSNTFVHVWEMEPYRMMAEDLGVPISVTACFGEWASEHDVHEETISRMRSNWEPL